MVRVPLPFRGVAVLLLAASTVVGQTPEPPAELLSIESIGPTTTPDFLREFSADTRHPLLSLMVDGELASLDAAPAQDSAKLKPTPKSSAAPAKTEPADGTLVDGCQDGCLLDGCPGENLCPTVPNLLPLDSAPPPCSCRKHQRRCGHSRCGRCGNSNLNWPSSLPFCFYGAPLVPGYDGCCHRRRCGHKRSCGGSGHSCSSGGWYGDGWNVMDGDGDFDGGFGSWGCGTSCMPPSSCGHKCHRRHHNRSCGCSGYGYPNGGYGDGGFCDCGTPPPKSCGRRCHHRRGSSHGCNNSGYGHPGWGGCGMASVYTACNVPCYEPCQGCKHHWFGRSHRRHSCQQSPPYCSDPMMTPGMGCDGFSMAPDGFSIGPDSFASDGLFGEGLAFEPMPNDTSN